MNHTKGICFKCESSTSWWTEGWMQCRCYETTESCLKAELFNLE